jgi:hypothetical protein
MGFIEACGSGITFSRVIVQAPGRFWRVPAGGSTARPTAAARPCACSSTTTFELMLAEARQVIACRNLHPVEERLAWWLLEAQDRMGEDKLPLTQEFLSIMLGVQRTTVTDHASQLQEQGLIRYRRGMIEVLDRKGPGGPRLRVPRDHAALPQAHRAAGGPQGPAPPAGRGLRKTPPDRDPSFPGGSGSLRGRLTNASARRRAGNPTLSPCALRVRLAVADPTQVASSRDTDGRTRKRPRAMSRRRR